MARRRESYNRTLIQYCIGFVSSLVLTFTAYLLVVGNTVEGLSLLLILGGLALIQMIVQLIFFLHVGSETRPRFRLFSLVFMTIVLVIIVGGSLWIMHHLNYNMMEMSSHEKDIYMTSQKDKGF
jgi:cytochrome o ubiquinol oxidase subunit IV